MKDLSDQNLGEITRGVMSLNLTADFMVSEYF